MHTMYLLCCVYCVYTLAATGIGILQPFYSFHIPHKQNKQADGKQR